MKRIKAKGVKVVVYEPELRRRDDGVLRLAGLRDLDEFKANADVIVANRMAPELKDVERQGLHAGPVRLRLSR